MVIFFLPILGTTTNLGGLEAYWVNLSPRSLGAKEANIEALEIAGGFSVFVATFSRKVELQNWSKDMGGGENVLYLEFYPEM